MLYWAITKGGHTFDELIQGYKFFVADVNRSQMQYEKDGKYKYLDYATVNQHVYSNQKFMALYHWGVFVTTFAWEHHLRLFEYYKRDFIRRIPENAPKEIIDLGAGSAIWSMLTANYRPESKITAVDISPKTVELSQEFIKANQYQNRIDMILGDALQYRHPFPADFGLSCFLLEHLETPWLLFENLRANLKDGGIAFVTGALTASEIDHIYEFKSESELVRLAEDAGFRVLSSLSAAPDSFPKKFKYIPRSMAMIIQKKHNDIW